MKLRFISPTLHGFADYSAGVGLIVLPNILELGTSSPLAYWLSVVTGMAVLLASSLTNYKLGIFRTIPFQGHLAIDLMVALAFVTAPWIFGFTGMDADYYVFNAVVVFTVVALSENDYSLE